MATSPTPTVNKDCFIYTFQIITSQMPRDHQGRSRDHYQVSDRPLNILRAASQVCRQWREMLLTCPLIWGRVIDIDINFRGEKRTKWMEEVVRRAGQAPLWISGTVFPPKPEATLGRFNTLAFFERLMVEWERVEELSVTIHRSLPDSIRSRFLSRAPILKVFNVALGPGIMEERECLFLDTLQSDSSRRLFADYAPKLQVMRAKQIAFRLDSSWLPTILEIYPIPTCFSLKDILVLLRQTPLLQTVYIMTDSYESCVGTLPSSPKLILPNLSDIYLGTNLNVTAKILNHISPGKLSRFHLRASHVSTDLTQVHDMKFAYILRITDLGALFIDSFKENLPSYIARCFLSNPSGEVRVALTTDDNNGTTRFAFDNFSQHGSSDVSTFSISVFMIREAAHDQLKTLTACLGDTLLLASASENGSLFEPIHGVTLEFNPTTPFIHAANLHAILAVFDDVQYINIDERSGRVLWSISSEDKAAASDQPHVLFPKLHTLYLTTPTYKDDRDVNGLTRFLLQRYQTGFPVARLDLTKCSMSSYAQDLRALEEVEGLEVLWRRPGGNSPREESGYCSYICGSGDPEQLLNLPIERVQL